MSLLITDTKVYVYDVATDVNDNIYVLISLENPGDRRSKRRSKHIVCKFNNTADLLHKFPVRGGDRENRLTVTDSSKVLVLNRTSDVVVVYETDGHGHVQFVREFGNDILKDTWDITASNDGRVMVVDEPQDCCVHIFSEHGDHLNKFKLECISPGE